MNSFKVTPRVLDLVCASKCPAHARIPAHEKKLIDK